MDSVLFVDVSMMLYIMYFPVYRSKEDYNNFTSVHSWLLLTLGFFFFELSLDKHRSCSFLCFSLSRQ